MTSNLRILPPADLHYADLTLFGYGAEAEVYKACYVPMNRATVAIKVLRPAAAGGARQQHLEARFRKEAEILWRTNHPNVVRVHEVMAAEWRGQATVAYSMEWLEGSFANLVNDKKAPLPVADLERHLRDALAGLGALHGRGVAVRDLRPQNLLLSAEGVLKLADLGMARTEDFAGSLVDQSSQFQAPEVLSGAVRSGLGREEPPVSAYFAADLYALGLIFYQAAVGLAQWEGLAALAGVYGKDGQGAALEQNQRWRDFHLSVVALPALREVRTDVPTTLGAAIDGMVRKDPGQRLGRVADALAALDSRLGREHDEVRDAHEDVPPVPPPRNRWKLFWKRHGRRIGRAAAATAAALALVALIAVGVNFLRPKTADLTIVPEGIAGLTVQWQGQEVPARSGTQTFSLRAATSGRLVIHRGGATLWDKPLTVEAGQPQTVDVRPYLPGRLTLTVNVPAEMRIEGQTDRHGVREEYELPAGRHRYRVTAAGYAAVEDEVTIAAGEDRELRVDLTAAPTTGTISIMVTPAGLDAGWRLTGPGSYALNGTGGAVLAGQPTGSYTVTWLEHEGYTKPNPATQGGELVGGREYAFTGRYRQKPNGSGSAGATASGTTDPAGAGGTTDPAAGALREWTIKGVKFAFRWIPADRATIGSPATEPCRGDDEAQFTAVLTRGFWMQETEVTQAQWTAVMGGNPSYFKDCSDCPVENVSWDDAQEFLQRLTAAGKGRYRLPTEVEWEYAARAGSRGPFGLPCADYNANNCYGTVRCLDAMAWYSANSGGKTHPVGLKRPNGWNLHDMSGNVWEWVADGYGPYPGGEFEDYPGPRYGEGRVLRGGSWNGNAYYTRVAARYRNVAGLRNYNIGFRCVRDHD